MKTTSFRPFRVAGLLKRELSTLIRNHANDPRLHQLLITDVEVSVGCTHAKVYVHITTDTKPQEVLNGLSAASGFLRSKLSANLALRTIPKLVFKVDDSYVQAERIQHLVTESGERT